MIDIEQIQAWRPGDSVITPEFEMESISLSELTTREAYKLMISTIAPRPIALISTCNTAGQENLAPFSFFNGVGTSPPALMFSIVPKGSGNKKDTLKNILETKEFVVNCVSEWMLAPVHHSSAEYPYGEDESLKVGFEKISSLKVKPSRIKGAAWQFECKLYNTMTVGDGSVGSGTIVVGEIIHAHVAKPYFENGAMNFQQMAPVARAGGMNYVLPGETMPMKAAEYNMK